MIARGDWQERQTEEENDAKHLHEDVRASVHNPVILGRQSQDPRAVVAAGTSGALEMGGCSLHAARRVVLQRDGREDARRAAASVRTNAD
jgi:hypothetical protein